MAKVYKVWVEIEECDDDHDSYHDVSTFPVCAGKFESLEDADQFIFELTGESSM